MINLSSKDINIKIIDVQKQWANGIIQIGKAYLDKRDYIYLTNQFLDKLYCFKQGKVLFKPTKVTNKQFRRNKSEFISYFIGHNKVSDEDKGFALEPWKSIYFENFDFMIFKNISFSMGNYYFIDYQEVKIKVEYSFGYILDKESKLKIVFHHSSIPYKVI